jgi:hypothetical protein
VSRKLTPGSGASSWVTIKNKGISFEPEQSPSGIRDPLTCQADRDVSWNLTLGRVPLPPSMRKGARVDVVAHNPLPFQPPFGSTMRPSAHLV